MRAMSQVLLLVSAGVCFLSFPVHGQDAGSLGDAARRARQQEKDQASNGSVAPKAVKVLTDEDAPPPTPKPAPSSASHDHDQGRPVTNAKPASGIAKLSPEQWKEMILAQKNGISAMQTTIDKLNDSIRFVAATCTGCREWNERQLQKKQEVERARAQLEEQKKRLAEMQDAARQQGFGSSVYDP